jgi:D-alanyl-D-alanine-carboxypeptidase/D-alanyl-D-alanine-endopeptidase
LPIATNLIYYGSGATGMAMVVIDGNQRVFRSFGETRPGNNVHPQLDSVIRIASLTKLMTSEMLVKLLDQGVVNLTIRSANTPRQAHMFHLSG